MVGKRECTMQDLTDAGPNMEMAPAGGRAKIFHPYGQGDAPSTDTSGGPLSRGYDLGHLCECRLKVKEQSEGSKQQLEGQV